MEKSNFDLTGFPIIGYQVILAGIIAALGLSLEEWLKKYQGTKKWASPRFKDIAVSTALFLTAFLIWKGIPLSENTFFDRGGVSYLFRAGRVSYLFRGRKSPNWNPTNSSLLPGNAASNSRFGI
jgi:hypothetical protein